MYACKLQFQHLNSVYVHGVFCSVVFDVLVASSSPVEGRGRDNMVSERKLQQWASMGHKECSDRGRVAFSKQKFDGSKFQNSPKCLNSRKS